MEKVFITGGSGCIGHYVIEQLLGRKDVELHLLVRDPKRFRFDVDSLAQVVVHRGFMEDIQALSDVISEMNVVIHIATDWADSEYSDYINVEQTHALFDLTDEQVCRRIVYFSTASILGPGNKPVKEAEELGSGYVRSKYRGYMKLQESAVKDRVVTVFPTLVVGGDASHPYSHISSGIVSSLNYMKIMRFIYLDGAFHFMHGRDIASVTCELAFLPELEQAEYVFGHEPLTLEKTIRDICRVFDIRMFFRFKITKRLLMGLAKILRIKIGPWEQYYLDNPYIVYDVVRPESFGLKSVFPTMRSVLKDIRMRSVV